MMIYHHPWFGCKRIISSVNRRKRFVTERQTGKPRAVNRRLTDLSKDRECVVAEGDVWQDATQHRQYQDWSHLLQLSHLAQLTHHIAGKKHTTHIHIDWCATHLFSTKAKWIPHTSTITKKHISCNCYECILRYLQHQHHKICNL